MTENIVKSVKYTEKECNVVLVTRI